MTKEEKAAEVKNQLMKPRLKVIADFPNNTWHKVGDVVDVGHMDKEYLQEKYLNFSAIFKPIKWYEDRTIDELMAVDFVEIIDQDKPGYYRPGDQVEVVSYHIINKKLVGYFLENGQRVENKAFKINDLFRLGGRRGSPEV